MEAEFTLVSSTDDIFGLSFASKVSFSYSYVHYKNPRESLQWLFYHEYINANYLVRATNFSLILNSYRKFLILNKRLFLNYSEISEILRIDTCIDCILIKCV